jgi:glyoxylase-like metal-dependent hydrolase (beta-lactamase superfamily II)
MIHIEKFVFNPFQENTYLLYDETNECILIDPGCYDEEEKSHLKDFISVKGLIPVKQIYTHCHVDHIFGNNFVAETWGLKPEIHKAGLPFLERGHEQGKAYGFEMPKSILPETYFEHGDLIRFGNSNLKVVYTPGHADGSVCFINDDQKFVITGDVLFRDSIGRTDFPTGDFDLLMKSIHELLFVLDDAFTVYCGHGPETSIGYEKVNNPFIRF